MALTPSHSHPPTRGLIPVQGICYFQLLRDADTYDAGLGINRAYNMIQAGMFTYIPITDGHRIFTNTHEVDFPGRIGYVTRAYISRDHNDIVFEGVVFGDRIDPAKHAFVTTGFNYVSLTHGITADGSPRPIEIAAIDTTSSLPRRAGCFIINSDRSLEDARSSVAIITIIREAILTAGMYDSDDDDNDDGDHEYR